MLPAEIEKKSFEIIEEELHTIYHKTLDPRTASIVKRVIHTTADFSYVDNLVFSENAVEIARDAIRRGVSIVTDTNMGKAGINKTKLDCFGGKVHCFMADEDIKETAKKNGTTRALASVDKAASLKEDFIFAVGNAPTALIRLKELLDDKKINPVLIIGVPVGFVHVVEAKEMIMESSIPYIVAKGRKGGSNVAAAICNALLYEA